MSEIHKKVVPLQAQTDHDTHDDHLQVSFDSSASVVGDAVGVPSRHWYVAIVGTNTEKSSRDKLIEMGYEAWIASQHEERHWRNGRCNKVEHVVIPLIVFVHATEQERHKIINYPFVHRFMTDKAGKANTFGKHPIAVIPEKEMHHLQFMLYQSDSPVSFITRPLRTGEKIRVVRGKLRSFEGYVVRYHDGDTYVVANIGMLGCAMVKISLKDIETI